MSSNGESQTMPTDKDIKINNINFIDEVKIDELNEQKIEEEKQNEKMLEVNDIIMNKDNEEGTKLTTLNDIIEIKKEEDTDNNNENTNNNEIKEEKEKEPEIITEIKQEINPEIKEENIELKNKEEEIKENNDDNNNIITSINNNKIETNSISNKSRSNSKSNSKKNTIEKQLDFSESNLTSNLNSNKKEPQSQKIFSKNIVSKSSEKRSINSINIIPKKKKQVKKINNFVNSDKIQKPKKKYNEAEFKKELEFFAQCEKRKKERIEKLKQDKINKEKESINKKNIHYHKKLPNKKLPSFLDRIYTKDIKKRQEKKQILTKIYTPSFKPFLYTKGNINTIKKRKPLNKHNNNLIKNYSQPFDGNNEENIKDNESKYILNKQVKFNINENNENFDEVEENDEMPLIYNRVVVENAMRNKLFNKGQKQKRNKSAETRRKNIENN